MSWKTSLFGTLAAIGLLLIKSDNPTIAAIGTILAGLGTLGTGFAARDQKVTDEQAGAKTGGGLKLPSASIIVLFLVLPLCTQCAGTGVGGTVGFNPTLNPDGSIRDLGLNVGLTFTVPAAPPVAAAVPASPASTITVSPATGK